MQSYLTNSILTDIFLGKLLANFWYNFKKLDQFIIKRGLNRRMQFFEMLSERAMENGNFSN